MSVRVVLILLIACWANLRSPAEVPTNLVVEGFSEPSARLLEEVGRYLSFPAATFQDWHPRRRDLLLTGRVGDTVQLQLVRLPEGPPEPLTLEPEPVAGGTFHPGAGEFIVFRRDLGGGESFQLYRLDMGRSEASLLTDGRSWNSAPRWSPGGHRIAYTSTRRNGRDTDLYQLDPDPTTRAPARVLARLSGGGWAVVDWSPDGTRLLLLSYVSINESSLHLVEVATGQRRQVMPIGPIPCAVGGARFAKDGRELIVSSDHLGEYQRLIRFNPDTGNQTPLGPEFGGDVEEFDLSPDGHVVAYLTNEQGYSVLRAMDLRDGRALRVPALPAGVATGLRWHPRHREFAVTVSSARSPSEVYSVDFRVNRLTRWTARGTAPGTSRGFVEPERVRVRGFDGLDLAGLLYRPDPRRFPGPRPVVVNLHGGPESQSRPGFQGRWNYLLEELGVALLYPNVRGSSGYGKSFLTLDNGRLREDAVRDVGAFLDWITTEEALDPGKVAVYGGSYGGYLVLASLLEYGDRLRCGVDVVGISSFPAFLEGTQEYRRDLRRAEYGDERDPAVAEFLHRISPLTQVERLRRPLFVVQGLNDPRVPVGESERLVRAVRAAGGTAWYLLARDEGHGFARKPNADFFFVSMVQFLRTHLLD